MSHATHMDAHYLSSLSATGRHVKAAEALQLGVVDQVTEHSCVDAAVKLALSVAGKTQKRKEKKKTHKSTRHPLV